MLRASALALMVAASAGAVPIVDIDTGTNSGVAWIDNDSRAVQSFTVTQDGLLTRIDVLIVQNFGANECAIDLCALHIGTPPAVIDVGNFFDGTFPIYSTLFHDDPVPGWFSITLDTPIAVTAGEVLSWMMEQEGVVGIGTSDYAGGALVHTCNGDPCIDPLTADPFAPSSTNLNGDTVLALPFDYAFRLWIEPNAVVVPEPSIGALLALGALAIHRRPRRRSRSTAESIRLQHR